MRGLVLGRLLVVLVVLGAATRAIADDFFSSSPGPLSNAHGSLDDQNKCDDCHKAHDKSGLAVYMGTDRLCGASGCHAKDQPHKMVRKVLLECERCHSESVWKPQKSQLNFDHNDKLYTSMPLIGS